MRTLVFGVGLVLVLSGCRPQSGGRSVVKSPVPDVAKAETAVSEPEPEPSWQTEGLLPEVVAAFEAKGEDGLPAGLETEPEPEAKIVYDRGMPRISLNGRLYNAEFNQSDDVTVYRLNAAAKAASLGVKINQLSFPPWEYESAPGVYDFREFDVRIRRLLRVVPDARIQLLLRMDFRQWIKVHPEAQVGYATGPADPEAGDDLSGRPVRPSAASPEYRAEVKRFLTLLRDYMSTKPWAKRVVSIRPCWGIYTEWHTYGMYEGPDVGPAMTAAFRRWKGGKYANENPPTMEERVSDDLFYLDADKHEKAIDFYACQQTVIVDFMKDLARTVKELFPGRLVGMYYGYVLATHPPEGSNVMLDEVLDCPDIDFLSNPADYTKTSRLAGGSYYQRTIPATFHRYGKLVMLEDDMRHYHVRQYVAHKGLCTSGPREAEMTTRRNWLNQYFDGCGLQTLDPDWDVRDRPFFMDAVPVWRAMGDTKRLLAGLDRPADSGNDTAVVVDWRERLRRSPQEAGAFDRVYAESILGLYASGVPVDLMTLDDFLAQPEGRYRKAVFLNVFSPKAEMRRKLGKRVSAEGFRSAWMVRCPFELAGASAKVCEKVPRGGDAWRALLTGVGAHAVGPAGHYIRRHGDVVMFHTGKTGTWEIDVPGCTEAVELYSGRRYTGSRFSVKTDGPDTLLFRLKGVKAK